MIRSISKLHDQDIIFQNSPYMEIFSYMDMIEVFSFFEGYVGLIWQTNKSMLITINS